MRHAWALIVVLGAGCVPWYRVDEVNALEADDPAVLSERLAACEKARATGPEPGVHCYEALLEHNVFESRASVGLAEALVAARRYDEARVVVENAVKLVVSGKASGGPEIKEGLAKQFLASYVDDELNALALARGIELGKATGETGAELTLPHASQQLPEAFRALAEAQVMVAEGKPSEALERYAVWLSAYGVPDLPEVQRWADAVLEGTLPLTDALVRRGDEALLRKDWVEAVVQYSLAFRYRPQARFEGEVADKLVQASSYLSAPEMLSPEARDLAAKAEALLGDGRAGRALHAYRRAIAIAPYWAEPRFNAAALYASLGMYAQAVEQIDWFLALDAGSEQAARASALREEWAKLAPAKGTP